MLLDNLLEKLNKLAVFFIAYTIIFLVFFKTLGYTLPFVLAFLFALLLHKPTKYLIDKFKFSNSIASLLTTFLFFSIIISLLSWGITSLTSEAIQLGKNTQSYIVQNTDNISNFFDRAQNYYKNLDPTILNAIESNLSSTASKASKTAVDITTKMVSGTVSFLGYIPYILMLVLCTLLATYFFTKDFTSAKDKFLNVIPSHKSDKLFYVFNESKKMLGNYMLSYMLIISLTFLETLIGFVLLDVKYAVILSILSAIFDILPVLGIGTIYIPLALIYFLSKNYFVAIWIVVLYVVVTVVRQIVEPKIVSSSLGIHPVPILAAIFIGLKANGVSGMFFCIFLVVSYTTLKKVNVL